MSSRWAVKAGDSIESRYGVKGVVEEVRTSDVRDPCLVVRTDRGETVIVSHWDVIEVSPAEELELEEVSA